VWTWVVPSVLTCCSFKVLLFVVVRPVVLVVVVAPVFVVVVLLLPRFMVPALAEPTLLFTTALVMVHEPPPLAGPHTAVPLAQDPDATLPPPLHEVTFAASVVQSPEAPLETLTTVPSSHRWETVAFLCWPRLGAAEIANSRAAAEITEAYFVIMTGSLGSQ
jgi:hypothetical protein